MPNSPKAPFRAEIVMFLLTQIIGAAGVYSAIRADMREMQVRISYLEKRADRADQFPTQK